MREALLESFLLFKAKEILSSSSLFDAPLKEIKPAGLRLSKRDRFPPHHLINGRIRTAVDFSGSPDFADGPGSLLFQIRVLPKLAVKFIY
jgi:hypothetical protein